MNNRKKIAMSSSVNATVLSKIYEIFGKSSVGNFELHIKIYGIN